MDSPLCGVLMVSGQDRRPSVESLHLGHFQKRPSARTMTQAIKASFLAVLRSLQACGVAVTSVSAPNRPMATPTPLASQSPNTEAAKCGTCGNRDQER